MFIITGACGFIGSMMAKYLNSLGIYDLLLVDDISLNYRNLRGIKYQKFYDLNDKSIFENKVKAVFHFGAISDTLEKDVNKIKKYNIDYTLWLNELCKEKNTPLLFASTSAIYGNGNGPLNLYAESKLECEKHISEYAACFRLFNVYGPNETHKNRMSSVIYRWYCEIVNNNSISIFKNSHNYKRDFIYVEDVCSCWYNCYLNYESGIFDLGSGQQNSFEFIADTLIDNVGGIKNYIEMPSDLNRQYQTNTLANIQDISKKEWLSKTTPLKQGIVKYIKHLKENDDSTNI
jgi:ADP-L-glycero-D-manno-heptose 6-epimerase